jgi:hypothetical protein
MSSNRKRASQRKAAAERDHLRSEISFGQFQNDALSLLIHKFNEQTQKMTEWQDKAVALMKELGDVSCARCDTAGCADPDLLVRIHDLLGAKISPKTVVLHDPRANPADGQKPPIFPVKIN